REQDGGVVAARGQEAAVRRKGEGGDGAAVPGERVQPGAGQRVPHPHLVIVLAAHPALGVLVGRGGEQGAVGREGQRPGRVAVAEGQTLAASGHFPEADLVVGVARGQGAAVGGGGQGGGTLPPGELVQQAPGLHVR